MAVNPAAQYPVYYGNTQTEIQVGGGKGGWSGAGSGAAEGAGTGAAIGSFFGPIGTGIGAIIGGVVGGVSGFMLSDGDPGHATVPGAPTFSPGTMPAQNFTNNDFGDFNTPSMQAGANTAHPGVLVQPPPPAPPVRRVPGPHHPGPPPGGNGGDQSLQLQQSSAAQTVRNAHIAGLNPSTISNDYLPANGGTWRDLALSDGGTQAIHSGFIAHLRSRYGQTPNTAISKGGMTVPSSYNTTANPGTPQQGAAPATSNVQLTPPPARRTLPYRPMIRGGVGR